MRLPPPNGPGARWLRILGRTTARVARSRVAAYSDRHPRDANPVARSVPPPGPPPSPTPPVGQFAAPPSPDPAPVFSDRKLDVAALLVIAGCALALHWSGLLGGPAAFENDTRVFYYPLAHWVSGQLQSGVFPLWIPTIFTGYPLFADGETGLLYLPQVLLLWWLPTPLAMVWLRVLHAFLAGVFTHCFLRTIRLSPMASLGGALVFAFGSFLTAQMHHENVVRSSIWLPLVLALLERMLQSRDARRRIGWTTLAALAFAASAVGLHVQPVLMESLAIGWFVVFRSLAGPVGWRRTMHSWSRRPMAAVAGLALLGTVLGGISLAMAQWLPLAEWARVSSRGGGVNYEFASAFGLAGENLATILFPYFFRLSDGATWWTLWQHWETEVYVGIPTLALALVGVAFSYRREVWYFAPLGVLALWIGMTHYAPFFNVHLLLWQIPGFSSLRAPGRFSYLFVFACAGLAALGMQALVDRRARLTRLAVALLGAVPSAALLAAVLALFPGWRAWLQANPGGALRLIQDSYLSVRAQYPIDPQVIYQGLIDSLDIANVKTGWTLALLAITVLLFLTGWELGPRRALIGQALFVAVIGVDLLLFSWDFHPTARLASLGPSSLPGVPAGSRVFLDGTVGATEPDSLTAAGISTVEGYSSLPSERHFDLYQRSAELPGFRRLWAAPYVVTPRQPEDLHLAKGLRFRADHPLAGGYKGSGSLTFVPTEPAIATSSLRLVSTLAYGFEVPQGQAAAEILVEDASGATQRLLLRAGIETAEEAIDRPSIRPFLRHQKPPGPTALDLPRSSPEGEDYVGHLYLADLALQQPVLISRITVIPSDERALVQVYGMGLIGSDGGVRSLDRANEEGVRVVGQTAGDTVLFDPLAAPRARVVDAAAAVDRARSPSLTPVQVMAKPGFDASVNLLIENLPVPALSQPPRLARAANVQDIDANHLRVTAEAAGPSFLVLANFYHRGWTARVDGQPTPIGIADAVFQAVPLNAGTHVVEFEFQPLSHLVGAIISALSLLCAAVLLVWAFTPLGERLRLAAPRRSASIQ